MGYVASVDLLDAFLDRLMVGEADVEQPVRLGPFLTVIRSGDNRVEVTVHLKLVELVDWRGDLVPSGANGGPTSPDAISSLTFSRKKKIRI